MRFEIDRGMFAELLVGVVNAVPSKTTYPVLQNVMVSVSGSTLALSGTDLDTYVRKEFRLEGAAEDGVVIVPGRKLSEVIRESGGDRVAFASKDQSITVEAGRARAHFTGLDPAEFPETPRLPEGVTFEFPLALLHEMFEACSFAVSKDDSRPAMTGVNWEVAKTEARMVGTDGHRLAQTLRRGKFAAKTKLIVSVKVFSLFPRGEEKVTIHVDPARVGFVFQTTTVIARVIEGPYPDYERVIPKGYPARAVLEHAVFSAALRRAAVFAHPVGRLTALEFRKGKLRLTAETPELGRSEEELDCEYSGEPLRIGFNAGYLLEILRHVSSDKVVIELSSPLSAGLFKPSEPKPDAEDTYLLMPIRLD